MFHRLRRGYQSLYDYVPNLGVLFGIIFLYFTLLVSSYGDICPTISFAILMVLLFLWVLWTHQFRVVGPLFWYELKRLARSGMAIWLRCGYGLVLLIGLWTTHANWSHVISQREVDPGITRNDHARLAEEFTTSIFVVQNLAGIILCSVYVGGSVVEERRKGSLEFLLTTHLTDHEIILGKLFARLTVVASILLVGLPVLAVVMHLGGVDILVLVGGFLSTLFTLVLVGSVTMFCSARSKSLVTAILLGQYIYWALTMGFCVPVMGYAASPFWFYTELDARIRGTGIIFWSVFDFMTVRPGTARQEIVAFQMILTYAFAQTFVALFVLRGAMRSLRKPLAIEPTSRPTTLELQKHVQTDEVAPEPLYITNAQPNIPLAPRRWYQPTWWQHPVWQREVSLKPSTVGEALGVLAILWMIFLLILGGSVALAITFRGGFVTDEVVQNRNFTVRLATVIAGVAACATTAFMAITTLGQERGARTLDGLLMLPEPWLHIFMYKWMAVFWKCSWLFAGLLLLWLLSALTAALHFVAVILLAAAVAAHVFFFSSLAFYLMSRCQTMLQASLLWIVVFLAVILAPWLLLPSEWQIAIDPIFTWWALAVSWKELSYPWRELPWQGLIFAMSGVVGYAVLGGLLWWRALRRFGPGLS